jgi:hypothetical protein
MEMTRRQLLAIATSAALLSVEPRVQSSRRKSLAWECLVLDLKEHCSLTESLQGFESCLASLGFHSVIHSREALPDALPQARQLVIPAATSIDAELAGRLLNFLENRGSVLLELGLAFVDPAICDSQRKLLMSYFQVEVQSPLPLRSGCDGERCVPYVDYLWPLATKVRDFSRVIPLSASSTEAIAHTRGMTIGLSRKVGKGTLTVFGSPLGPVLRAGDMEAQSWMHAFLSATKA